ncbi:YigZ family protein [Pedobacter sp. JY14-1]|uniref:IMPACT family protein n=1 Tax=Pedobacter sp. JY14-1 TaxID=3034151 RepID=UPI0023E34078|nr:YigZ family protein [Pedobacter sp. JY14-1]
MLFDDTYKTIVTASEGLFREKGSKFLAYAYPIRSEADIKPLVQELKALHPKARHHCWAMRFSPDRGVYRVQDDGEPSGTAGRPILNAILSADLTNVLIVVVRYFGGTLLGVPGLINAYRTAAADALQQARIIEKTVNDCYEIRFDYLLMNDIMRIMKEEQAEVLGQDFDEACTLRFGIRKSALNGVLAKLQQLHPAVSTKYLSTI